MIHELKILPQYFKAVKAGTKTFEIRKNDRGFKVGDTLVLKEWEYIKGKYIEEGYTGQKITKEVTYILESSPCGLGEGYCILGLKGDLDIKEYQLKSTRTLNKELTREENISNMVFGICGESGEVADILKKHLYQGHMIDKKHLKEEIGDVMYYIVNLATMYNINMQDVLKTNIDKLNKRYPQGFEINKSIEREE